MASKRAKALWNLTWMLGLPALAVAGLLGFGIHLGDLHREKVLGFERDWMAWSGLTESHPVGPGVGSDLGAEALPAGDAGVAESASDSVADSGPDSGPDSVADSVADSVTVADTDAIADTDAVTVADADSVADSAADAASLGDQRAVPVTLRIKVLVDERFADAHADWLSLVQRTVATASRIYRADFGIELQLTGAVRWARALDGMGSGDLQQALKRHGREGADVLLGFLSTPLDAAGHALGAPQEHAPLNGAYGLVGDGSDGELPHLRGLLRTLGHLLGARAIEDRESDDYRLGSWMSDAPAPAGRPPWIDLQNRKRILSRKARPFEPDPRGTP